MEAIAILPAMVNTKKEKPMVQFLSAAQVAKRFKVTARTVVRWIDEGKLPGAFQVNPDAPNTPFLIPVASVEAYEKTRETSDNNGDGQNE
jgi:hypothetical protein